MRCTSTRLTAIWQPENRARFHLPHCPILGVHFFLDLDAGAAVWAARFRAQARGRGRKLELGDALIAGTAKSRELTVATRNVRDFAGLDIDVVNPWDAR